jgi:hypothetical protein
MLALPSAQASWQFAYRCGVLGAAGPVVRPGLLGGYVCLGGDVCGLSKLDKRSRRTTAAITAATVTMMRICARVSREDLVPLAGDSVIVPVQP